MTINFSPGAYTVRELLRIIKISVNFDLKSVFFVLKKCFVVFTVCLLECFCWCYGVCGLFLLMVPWKIPLTWTFAILLYFFILQTSSPTTTWIKHDQNHDTAQSHVYRHFVMSVYYQIRADSDVPREVVFIKILYYIQSPHPPAPVRVLFYLTCAISKSANLDDCCRVLSEAYTYSWHSALDTSTVLIVIRTI